MIRGWRVWLFIAFLILDVSSKWAALRWIPHLEWGSYPFGGIPVFSSFFGVSFSLNTIFNTGAAWGLFAGHPGLLFSLRIGIIIGLGVYIYFRQSSFLKKLSFWLIGAGAIGNAVDYLLYGHVVDFFHFVFFGYSFPIFNLADSYITLGVMGLFFAGKNKQTISAV